LNDGGMIEPARLSLPKKMKTSDARRGFCEVASVQEAVELAEEFVKDRIFDLFRGQIRNFPLTPSIFRFGVNRDATRDRLNRLAHWVHTTREVESLHQNDDAILAVAQHYGIPSPLLDFTTEPQIAGFFASDGTVVSPSSTGLNASCIVCVSRHSLAAAWSEVNRRAVESGAVVPVRLVEIDVRNLWRLQAQHGVFIESHIAADILEPQSGFFRILFPYTGPLKGVPRSMIYPDKKSHLELLLDQFFDEERFSEDLKRAEGFFGPPICIGFSDKTQLAQIAPDPIFPEGAHPSWAAEATRWLKEPDERFTETHSSRVITLQVRRDERPKRIADEVRSQVMKLFDSEQTLRNSAVDWAVLDAQGKVLNIYYQDSEFGPSDIPCQRSVSHIWNGMRALPCSDRDIATSIGNYVAFSAAVRSRETRHVGIEFSARGPAVRASASAERLVNALRQDVFMFVIQLRLQDIATGVGDGITDLLRMYRHPAMLFEFQAFAGVFASDIIPSQMLYRAGDLVLFNPLRISAFGES
jgi:hypothetical protein